MEIGPIQMMVLGFDQPRFGGHIIAELERLKAQKIIRVIDALVVHKNAEGHIATLKSTDLEPEQAEEIGAIIGALVGVGAAGEQGMSAGAELGADEVEKRGGHVLNPEEWYALENIPNDSAAAIILLEHRWAIPLRNAIVAEGGVAYGDAWLHPRDLVAVGLLAAVEADVQEQLRPTG